MPEMQDNVNDTEFGDELDSIQAAWSSGKTKDEREFIPDGDRPLVIVSSRLFKSRKKQQWQVLTTFETLDEEPDKRTVKRWDTVSDPSKSGHLKDFLQALGHTVPGNVAELPAILNSLKGMIADCTIQIKLLRTDEFGPMFG